jgi:hypothetical protein
VYRLPSNPGYRNQSSFNLGCLHSVRSDDNPSVTDATVNFQLVCGPKGVSITGPADRPIPRKAENRPIGGIMIVSHVAVVLETDYASLSLMLYLNLFATDFASK